MSVPTTAPRTVSVTRIRPLGGKVADALGDVDSEPGDVAVAELDLTGMNPGAYVQPDVARTSMISAAQGWPDRRRRRSRGIRPPSS